MRVIGTRLRVAAVLGAVSAALLISAGSAAAGTANYPGGGSGFGGGAEGWSSSGTSCTPGELLCSSEAVYDASTGNPPGSIAVKTTLTVNLAALFKGTATWTSPQFTVPVEAITGAQVHLDSAFDPGGLVDVGPEATYAVTLTDLSSGISTAVLSGKLDKGDEAFATASAPASVVGGHTYRLSIATETAQSTVAASVISGTTSLNIDNVGLTVQSSAGGGGSNSGGKGNSGGKRSKSSLSDRRLLALLQGGAMSSPAVLRGNRLFVKVNCPAKIDRACHIAAQGMLTRRKAATAKRVVKVRQGKGKLVALRVKPAARGKLAGRKRLLVREKVRAGKAKATVYRQRKLIRR